MDVRDVPAMGEAELDEGVGDLACRVFVKRERGIVRHGTQHGLQSVDGATHTL